MSLREVDVSGRAPVAPPLAPPLAPGEPELAWVAIGALRIDDDYQRPLGPKNWQVIARVAKAFDWAMFTPVMVARLGDGTFALIDGQHRAHAAALAGFARVPALVVEAAPDAQARAFSAINTQRTAISTFNLYKAALAAGEGWALEAELAVRKGGCRLMTYNRSALTRLAGEIYAVGLVREHVAQGRAGLVERGLLALRSCARGEDAELFKVGVLKPWLAALQEVPLPAETLAQFLDRFDILSVIDGVGQLKSLPANEGQSAFALARGAIVAALKEASGAAAGAPLPRVRTVAKPAPAPKRVSAPAPEPIRPAASGVWTVERDAALIASQGRYAALAELAQRWGLTIQSVTSRWHRVRVAA